ncbi:MAG TPA: ABC transporter permease [Solirubrobacter sp.]|nr:ABC transporter permease [Solirubrobacter sp.]
MARFVIRRTISMALVLFAISVLTFLIFQKIPNGDPAQRLAGRTSTPETVAAIRRTWGFDKPVYDQYLLTMKQILTGKVISYTQQVNVEAQIKQDLPPTISLAVGAAIIWMGLGTALGLLSAVRAGGLLDRGLTVVALVGISTPVFLLGAVMLYVLAYRFALFPDGGYVGITTDPLSWLSHMILPWLALSTLFIGVYSRVLRSNVLDTIHEDYVRTAEAKGLSRRRVLIRHVLRTSMIPIVALWGLDFAAVVGGGAILTESVFNLHGVGQYAATSIGQLDVPPVLVIVMFGAFFVVLLSALTDVGYALLDPRVRLS